MKFKDYLRLGKISIKSRKKSTRNTAFGLAFALIILIPIIFFTLAFSIDLKQKVNEQQSISTFDIKTTTKVDTNNRPMLNVGEIDKVLNTEGVKEYIKYENLFSNYYDRDGNVIKFDIGRETYKYSSGELQMQNVAINKSQIKVVDSNVSNFIPSSYVNDLKKMGKEALIGPGFTGDKKGQIIINEKLLNAKLINPIDVIGKHMTLYGSLISEYNNMFLDNDNNPNNLFKPDYKHNREYKLLVDFEIVGVLSEAYYNINYKTMNTGSFIVADTSLYQDGELKYMPQIKEIDSPYGDGSGSNQRKNYLCTYPSDINLLIEKANNEKVIPTILPSISFVDYGEALEPMQSYEVVCEDFDAASKLDAKIIAALSKDYENMAYNPFCDSKFIYYKQFSTMGMYMALALGIFGGIILFATLLNLYNTINYSVEKRKNYIGMMRAIGSKNASIIKSYIVEILLIFKKAFLWILIFSAGFSYLIKMGIDAMFNTTHVQDITPIVISLNFNYYFITLGVIVLFALLVALTFSYISCRPVTKKSILDVLVEDK